MEPHQPVMQQDLAYATGVNEGHVSRIVGKLADEGLVERVKGGVRATNPDLLLDAWRDEYRFTKHRFVRGHIAGALGNSQVLSIAETLSRIEEPYAMTALPAAWLMTHHAGFRLSTVFLHGDPSPGLMNDLNFREEPRGANTWLVKPNDEGVFYGAHGLGRDILRTPSSGLLRPQGSP